MARKRRKTKSTGRRRRIGAVRLSTQNKDILTLAAGAVVGAAGKRALNNAYANYVAKKVQTQPTYKPIDAKIVNAVELGVGVLVATKSKNNFVKGAGLGFAADAGVELMQSLGVLKGIGRIYSPLVPFQPRPLLNGVTKVPTVGAASVNPYGFPNAAQVGSTSKKLYGGVY